ncbi:hypothetical protein ACR79S_21180 [Sphingobacterium spiritivorum]|uniref:hypothetical protein n=1 Tax=Sphingobacterium spiritivorum TaxID=258 RepID=UPI003DA365B0
MLKAAALHLAIVISLIITLILGSMLYLAFFFRDQTARFNRYDLLQQELEAGITIMQTLDFPYTAKDSILHSVLYSGDSISVSKQQWGLFDIGYVRSYIQKDTLQKTFMMGIPLQDSLVLYVADEDRPISVSGKTSIIGNVQLPKAGIQPAYVDGKYYSGHKDIVQGKKKDSERQLPKLQQKRLNHILELYGLLENEDLPSIPSGNLRESFYQPAAQYRSMEALSLTADSISGHVILVVDSTLHISANSTIHDAIIVARSISIEKGFKGSAQFFALDSIIVEDEVNLQFPTVLGIVKSPKEDLQPLIRIGKKCHIEGTVFYYEDKRSPVPAVVSVGKESIISGDMLVYGMLQYEKPVQFIGTTYCYRFLVRTPASIYENFLIDLTLDRKKLSPYHLRSFLWDPSQKTVSASLLQSLNND